MISQQMSPSQAGQAPVRTGELTPAQLNEVLKEIGQVLVKHGCENQIGVFRRQFHFNVKEGEVLVESLEHAGESYIFLAKRCEVGSDMLARSWLFPNGKPRMVTVDLSFAEVVQKNGEVTFVSNEDWQGTENYGSPK